MKLALMITGGLMVASIMGFVYLRDPAGGYPFYPGCGFKEFTGYHCPGCGGTRSAHALLHGRLGQAFYFNPLFIISLGIGAVAIGRWYIFRKRKISSPTWTARRSIVLGVAIFGTLVTFWVVRNLAWYPFLKPPAFEAN